jgi:hypothetical protein
MTARKPDQQLGPVQAGPPLDTPRSVQELHNWLKDLHAQFPGDSIALTINTDLRELKAIIE